MVIVVLCKTPSLVLALQVRVDVDLGFRGFRGFWLWGFRVWGFRGFGLKTVGFRVYGFRV